MSNDDHERFLAFLVWTTLAHSPTKLRNQAQYYDDTCLRGMRRPLLRCLLATLVIVTVQRVIDYMRGAGFDHVTREKVWPGLTPVGETTSPPTGAVAPKLPPAMPPPPASTAPPLTSARLRSLPGSFPHLEKPVTSQRLRNNSPERIAPFPVVMLAHARPERLDATLKSLMGVHGIDIEQVHVVQDGSDRDVANVVRKHGLHLRQLPTCRPTTSRKGITDARGARIAAAYKQMLSLAFDELTSDEAILVVEDDMYFSPDLMGFMLAGYAVLRHDPSLWCVSAWNDNGFSGLANSSEAPKRMLRTGFFPGLGWLLTRRLYKTELEPAWPAEHWDHWMRSEVVHRTSRGRECIIPQVPRTFHHGVYGTFMDASLHSRYFGRIAHSMDDSLRWPASDFGAIRRAMVSEPYERRLRERIASAVPLTSFTPLLGGWKLPLGSLRPGESQSPIVIWYDVMPRDAGSTVFTKLASYFGLWHELRRGSVRPEAEASPAPWSRRLPRLRHPPCSRHGPLATDGCLSPARRAAQLRARVLVPGPSRPAHQRTMWTARQAIALCGPCA